MKTGLNSFRRLFGDGRRIEIPMIQRDYAQGRPGREELRTHFVDAFFDALREDPSPEPLDLDFVYGRWRPAHAVLEPLDGQQRLTTLFLLHWYLANRDGCFEDFQSWMNGETGSCFSYRTRPGAKEFFDSLVGFPVDIAALRSESRDLSAWISDQSWFVRRWCYDPTVRGCLTMLDAIHDRFHTGQGAYQRLINDDDPPIVFRLLLLEEFNLSDDLYIKMNARGKALTSFEVFKAQLEEFIGQTFQNAPCPHDKDRTWRKYVSWRFDTAWTDFLWRYRGEGGEIDPQFMQLIRVVALIECVESAQEDGQGPKLSEDLQRLLELREPTLTDYKNLGCLNKSFIKTLVDLLDTLATAFDSPTLGFLETTDYFDESSAFERMVFAGDSSGAVTFVDWVKFYAYCACLLAKTGDVQSDSSRRDFAEWMRVVSNLADNTEIDSVDRFARSLSSIRKMVDEGTSAGFLEFVAEGGIESGFSQRQRQEERLKAQLLLRGSGWRGLINEAETHAYFRGDIGFLLAFSGVMEHWSADEHCTWSDDRDEHLREAFVTWHKRTCVVFPADSSGLAKFPDFLWERALLATGDYLLRRRRNRSLIVDSDRDASWKRLLRTDRRDVVRAVLERIDPDNVADSLRSVVNEGLQENEGDDSAAWRRLLVSEPRLLKYCKKREIRINGRNQSVYLLSKRQRNGFHTDLFVYALYLQLSDRAKTSGLNSFKILKRPVVKGAVDPHHLRLRSKSLGLTLTAKIKNGMFDFALELDDLDSNLELPPEWKKTDERYVRRQVPTTAATEVLDEVFSLKVHTAEPA